MTDGWKNKLYFGDNLNILRDYIASESVDLIYLDPPFNSNATYNVLFREKSGEQSVAQITAFEDTWEWGLDSRAAYEDVVTHGPQKLGQLLQAMFGFLGETDMMAYLVMMAQRLVELRRVLKPAGSIYLHCDATASHYLKLLMDAVFGPENFRREIVWRSGWVSGYKAAAKNWIRNHDIILYYLRTPVAADRFNMLFVPHPPGYKRRGGVGANPKGVAMDDVWTDIYSPAIMSFSQEKLGYPTQKPEALLERIITASSNEGDVILDPFCGCGTTIAAAERLNRRWIGIDITHLAISLMRHRLHKRFEGILRPYEVVGDPKDVASARALAEESGREGRFKFEWWAVGLVGAHPGRDRRKGADRGIDGYIIFFDDDSGKGKTVIVQVKSGAVRRDMVATLKGDMEREGAAIGVLITLEEPTKPMRDEAVSAGFYTPEHYPNLRYPRVQILTIQELLDGKQPDYPRMGMVATFKSAKRYRRPQGTQATFDDDAVVHRNVVVHELVEVVGDMDLEREEGEEPEGDLASEVQELER